MNAIRIHKQIESETLHLPELKPLIGKCVEIIVLEENGAGTAPGGPYEPFFELAGKDLVDPEAYKQLRATKS